MDDAGAKKLTRRRGGLMAKRTRAARLALALALWHGATTLAFTTRPIVYRPDLYRISQPFERSQRAVPSGDDDPDGHADDVDEAFKALYQTRREPTADALAKAKTDAPEPDLPKELLEAKKRVPGYSCTASCLLRSNESYS